MTADTPLQRSARTALACLDLTSLNDADTPADIQRLCARAQGADGAAAAGPAHGAVAAGRSNGAVAAGQSNGAVAAGYSNGAVAAVCVWPRFAAQARALLPAAIRVAAVANFPDGGTDVQAAVRDTANIVQAGAQEVDVVLPWRALAAGDAALCAALLAAVRRACEGLTLKVILETGQLADEVLIRQACGLALDAGADFLKTSTGRAPVNATPGAAALLLQAIAANPAADPAARARVGFKPAGGIRRVADAQVYIDLVRVHLGEAAVGPARFRIGASGLLDDIRAVLGGADGAAAPAGPAVY